MNKRWMAVVMGALLVGTLVGGVVWARPGQSAQAADHIRKLTVPAAFFHPATDDCDYGNNGLELESYSAGSCTFTAPVVFPCLPSVTVERIIFSVKDQSGVDACVSLYRSKPNKGIERKMASVCSSGSQPGVINYTDDTIDYPVVWPSQGPYLWLNIEGTDVHVYGVRVEYKRNI